VIGNTECNPDLGSGSTLVLWENFSTVFVPSIDFSTWSCYTLNMSKTYTEAEIRENLSTNPKWVERALIRLYERQTADEQRSEHTVNLNFKGFQPVDAKLFSSFAKQILKGYSLSPKQLACCGVKTPALPAGYRLRFWRGAPAIAKYAKQLLKVIEEDAKASS
jgi:hypothetical protein